MTLEQVLSLVPQVLGFLAALVAAAVSFRNGRKLNVVHVEMNSRFSQLLETERKLAHLMGHKEGVAEGLLAVTASTAAGLAAARAEGHAEGLAVAKEESHEPG